MRDLSAAMNEIIAANVKLLRQRHAPNQTVFGEQIGVSQATVARWERGGDMKPESLARLAELAGCSASEFITQLLPEQASRVGRATFEGASTLWLPVQLPSEDVLHEMFLALLEPLKTEKSQDVIARRLAQLLPGALSQSVSRQP